MPRSDSPFTRFLQSFECRVRAETGTLPHICGCVRVSLFHSTFFCPLLECLLRSGRVGRKKKRLPRSPCFARLYQKVNAASRAARSPAANQTVHSFLFFRDLHPLDGALFVPGQTFFLCTCVEKEKSRMTESGLQRVHADISRSVGTAHDQLVRFYAVRRRLAATVGKRERVCAVLWFPRPLSERRTMVEVGSIVAAGRVPLSHHFVVDGPLCSFDM